MRELSILPVRMINRQYLGLSIPKFTGDVSENFRLQGTFLLGVPSQCSLMMHLVQDISQQSVHKYCMCLPVETLPEPVLNEWNATEK